MSINLSKEGDIWKIEVRETFAFKHFENAKVELDVLAQMKAKCGNLFQLRKELAHKEMEKHIADSLKDVKGVVGNMLDDLKGGKQDG